MKIPNIVFRLVLIPTMLISSVLHAHDTFENLIRTGNDLIMADDFTGAAQAAESAFNLAADLKQKCAALHLAGHANERAKLFDKAHESYARILNLPNLPPSERFDAMFSSARAYSASGAFDDAHAIYTQIASDKDAGAADKVKALNAAADTWLREKKFAEARKEYAKIISLEEITDEEKHRAKDRLERFSIAMEAHFLMSEIFKAYYRALNNRTNKDISDFEKRADGFHEFWEKHDLQNKSRAYRFPDSRRSFRDIVEIFRKTDFIGLKPSARKELKGPQDEIWIRELFAGMPAPANIPNLFPLPEIWTFHIDIENKGLEKGYFKVDYDDREGWQPVSSWNFPGSQGYTHFVRGYFWYRTTFEAPRFPEGKKVFLRIGSLDDQGDVYLNGYKVGSQPSPHDWDKSFVMDVTGVIKPGEKNVLAVHGHCASGAYGVWRPSALYTD